MATLKSKKILLGITGGIAAYKSAELVRLCKKAGVEVKVIMTSAAQEFIRPLTFGTLSGYEVYTDLFKQDLDYKIEHIALARWADIILIAPATANIIAKEHLPLTSKNIIAKKILQLIAELASLRYK